MSKLVMKNNINSELAIIHSDNKPAKSIIGTDITVAVDTINDFPLGASDGDTVIVRDLDRGGTFIYDSSKVAEHNDGTNFNGWIRQYSGAVNVKWFGAKGDGITDDTISFNSAIIAALHSRIDLSPTGSDSLNLSLTAGIVQVQANNGEFYINNDLVVYDKVHLLGNNVILKYGVTGRVVLNQFGAKIKGFTFLGTGLSGSSLPAIFIPETGDNLYTAYSDDTLTTIIEENTFKNFISVCNMNSTGSYHGLSVKILKNRVSNCRQFSLSLKGDKVTLKGNSFTGSFKNDNQVFIVNQSGIMLVEDNFFTPFGGTSNHPIDNRWFDNYGSLIIKNGNRFGAESISTDVSTFLTDENVSLIYNFASYYGLVGTTPNLFEDDAKTFISIHSNYIDFRNASLIKFFNIPNYVYVKDNYGFSGTKFDANLNITTAKYALDFSNVNPTDITSAIATIRRFVTIDVDIPSSWMYLGEEKRFLGSIYELLNSNSINDSLKFQKSFIPTTINDTYAEFNIDTGLFPESFNARITVVGVSSIDNKAKDIYEADLIVTSIVDVSNSTRTKSISLANTRVVNSESGSGAKSDPSLNALWWGGTGSPTTTVDRYDIKIRLSNIGIPGDFTSCYCTLDLRV